MVKPANSLLCGAFFFAALRGAFFFGPLVLGHRALAAEGWTDLAPLRTPRQEVGVAALDGNIYVVGGILASRAASNLVERYDPAGDRWEAVRNLPANLHHIGAASLDGKLYVIGGLDGSFDGVNTCFSYDPGANSWEELAPLPTRRGAMGVAVLDGRIYAAGGQRTGGTVREHAVFTPGPGGGSWEELPQMPTARNHLAGAAAGGFFYAISGRSSGLRAEVERYDPVKREWSARAPIPTPRGGIAAAVIGSRIYVFGGEGNSADPSGVFPQNEMYDTALDRWFPRLEMSIPRHGIGAAVLGRLIYIPGGSRVEGFGVNDANTAYSPPDSDGEAGEFVRGDANLDGERDISDALAILVGLFVDGAPVACPDAHDANDDGAVDVSDAIRLLEYLFLGASEPPPPGPLPGPDPSSDPLGC